VQQLNGRFRMTSLAQLRTGSHRLAMIFTCPHYSDLRAEHQDIFAGPGVDLKDFFDQDPGRVAAFVAACRRRAAETIHDEDLQALLGHSQIQETQA
jgi:hypothetical protein